jgi:predicted RNA-binding Zn-ribbon protein involved in translation (DUF1610 family)
VGESVSFGLKRRTLEQIKKNGLDKCPVCGIKTKLIMDLRCVHCGELHYVFECPKCKNRIVVPEFAGVDSIH